MKKIALFVSSLTGNTQKIADALQEGLRESGYDVFMQDSNIIMNPVIHADFYILCFWCRRGCLDDDSKKLLQQFTNTPFLAVGTCGHYPESAYGLKIKNQVTAYIEQSNPCISVFLSPGAVMLESTNRRRRLPLDHPHHLDEAGYMRHLESQKHPDSLDCQHALELVKSHLSK